MKIPKQRAAGPARLPEQSGEIRAFGARIAPTMTRLRAATRWPSKLRNQLSALRKSLAWDLPPSSAAKSRMNGVGLALING